MPRYFLITIDTEGDNLWSQPREIKTENTRFLPRFQSLCEKYGFKPTYLTNYEMAICPRFQEFGHDVLQRSAGEIGMHLHAWNSPPDYALTDDDLRTQPYLIEYPENILRDKVTFMTELLEETFQRKMVSHRAGRWSFDEVYARALHDLGYLVDCSVTPHVTWAHKIGDPAQNGGTDFRFYPEEPYFPDLDDISKKAAPGGNNSTLLEAPMSVILPPPWTEELKTRLNKRWITWKIFCRFYIPRWLYPESTSLKNMLSILHYAEKKDRPCVEFMIHSSELMPGGSPTFPDKDSIERLYDNLEALFAAAHGRFQGATLEEFYHLYTQARS